MSLQPNELIENETGERIELYPCVGLSPRKSCWLDLTVRRKNGRASSIRLTPKQIATLAKNLAGLAVSFEDYLRRGSYTCPKCGAVSHNPHDVANRYCVACHVFEDDPKPLPGQEVPSR